MNLATAVALAAATLTAATLAATTTDLGHRGRGWRRNYTTVVWDVTTEVGDNRVLSVELGIQACSGELLGCREDDRARTNGGCATTVTTSAAATTASHYTGGALNCRKFGKLRVKRGDAGEVTDLGREHRAK
jgi:hypothetical protein